MAEVVFTKSVEQSNFAPESHDFWVKLDYEFLEDIYEEWEAGGDDVSIASEKIMIDADTIASFEPDDDRLEYQSIEYKTSDEIQSDLEKKKNHPLMLMVSEINFNCISSGTSFFNFY